MIDFPGVKVVWLLLHEDDTAEDFLDGAEEFVMDAVGNVQELGFVGLGLVEKRDEFMLEAVAKVVGRLHVHGLLELVERDEFVMGTSIFAAETAANLCVAVDGGNTDEGEGDVVNGAQVERLGGLFPLSRLVLFAKTHSILSNINSFIYKTAMRILNYFLIGSLVLVVLIQIYRFATRKENPIFCLVKGYFNYLTLQVYIITIASEGIQIRN